MPQPNSTCRAFCPFWGMSGGLMVLISCLLILFGRIEIGSATDLIHSLPIWINEMVLPSGS